MGTVLKWLLVIVFVIFVCFVIALPTMWLWNWLMPIIFMLPTITYLQALGLNLLSAILVKSQNVKTD
jgi:sensor histidine kinase YesM